MDTVRRSYSAQLLPQELGNFDKRLRRSLVRCPDHHRPPLVPAFANLREQGHLTQEGKFLSLRFGPPPSMSKNLKTFTGRCHEITHVLHDAEDGNIDLLKHGDPFAHHAE